MIPVEMMHYPSWVCWRYEDRQGKRTKIPYSPRTLQRASVTDPAQWGTYAEAVSASQTGNFSGIGFVLSKADPFSIIDLDDPTGDPTATARARQVLSTFADTYTEISPSGKGMHIILRGQIDGGRRRGKIEAYGTERYFTMTGCTYRDCSIIESDYHLAHLWEDLGSTAIVPAPAQITGSPQRFTDEEVYNKACETNEKFKPLFEGDFHQWYSSQSEADFALINILSFYSRNRDQITRMFHYSALGKRPKAKRLDYLNKMIDRSFDNLSPEISLEELMGNFRQQIEGARKAKAETPEPMLGEVWTLPPGLVGDIAKFIYEQAPRPVQEIALAGAIGLMAGICGRQYNVSSTGLNQYVLILAPTGRGKEAARGGITKLMHYVSQMVPKAEDFVGPAEIASGQALFKYLGTNPCFVSILGEFGITLEQMCAPNASAAQQMLRKVLLDTFGKSGQHDTLSPAIYSDKANNTSLLHSPAFSLLGEATPDSFFANLHMDAISWGVLPRFTCIEYSGKRTKFNKTHADAIPSQELITSLQTLCADVLALAHKHQVVEVQIDPDAGDFIDEFNEKCDAMINARDGQAIEEQWNRGHLKVLKLAALIAVGCNSHIPVITMEMAKWATNLVERDIANILNRFESGRVGRDANEQGQVFRLAGILKDYIFRPYDASMNKYSVSEEMHRDRVIQWGYLSKRLLSQPTFKDDRLGGTFALKRALGMLISDGVLIEINSQQLTQRYSYTGKAYFVVDAARLG